MRGVADLFNPAIHPPLPALTHVQTLKSPQGDCEKWFFCADMIKWDLNEELFDPNFGRERNMI